MSNQQWTSSQAHSIQRSGGITLPKQFLITYVGWLILQILSPEEWQNTIGAFLTVESK